MNRWHCDKCKEAKERNELFELLGWGFYFCEACVEKFIQPERSKREDHESGCGALNSMET